MLIGAENRTRLTRRCKRYIVNGSAVLEGPGGESRGLLLNVGQGGILVRTNAAHEEGSNLTLYFHVSGYPETFAGHGQVVGTKGILSAIKFMEEPEGIKFLLAWLGLQHCTWSGVE
jgi:hypothetical protein